MTSKIVVIAVGALVAAGCAAVPGKISQTEAVAPLYTEERIGLQGYDPVAYFTDGMPVKGSQDNTVSWHGAQWQFATQEHAEAFKKEPEKYAPQYGGYCALAVAHGSTAPGDAHQWAVVEGKLYVLYNRIAKFVWDRERKDDIVSADVNWPLIPKQDEAAVSSSH